MYQHLVIWQHFDSRIKSEGKCDVEVTNFLHSGVRYFMNPKEGVFIVLMVISQVAPLINLIATV